MEKVNLSRILCRALQLPTSLTVKLSVSCSTVTVWYRFQKTGRHCVQNHKVLFMTTYGKNPGLHTASTRSRSISWFGWLLTFNVARKITQTNAQLLTDSTSEAGLTDSAWNAWFSSWSNASTRTLHSSDSNHTGRTLCSRLTSCARSTGRTCSHHKQYWLGEPLRVYISKILTLSHRQNDYIQVFLRTRSHAMEYSPWRSC